MSIVFVLRFAGRISNCHLAKLLLEFRVIKRLVPDEDAEVEVDTWVLHLASGAGQAGAYPMRLNFIRCYADEEVRNLYMYGRKTQVAPGRSVPFCTCPVVVGMLEHYDMEAVTDIMVDFPEGMPQAREIHIEALQYDERLGDQFLATSERGEAVERVLVEDCPPLGDRASKGSAKREDSDAEWGDDLLPSTKTSRTHKRVGRAFDALDDMGYCDLVEDLEAIMGDEGEAMLEEADKVAAELFGPSDTDSEEGGDGCEPGEGEGSEGEEAAPPPEGHPHPVVAAEGPPECLPHAVAAALAPPEPEPITARNCLTTLRGVKRSCDLAPHLPEFECSNASWETRVRSTGEVLGKVRMIQGLSLRGDCRLHRPTPEQPTRCKMHCDIKGKWEELDSLMSKWFVAGSAMTREEHSESAAELMAKWRSGAEV